MAQKKQREFDKTKVCSTSGYFRSRRPTCEVMEQSQLLYDNGSGYTISYVNSEAELQCIFALRYEEYCVKMHSLDPADYPDGIEVDAFDAVAAHFSGKLNNEVVGTSRLVFPVRGVFLMETSEEAFTLPDWIPRDTSAESSRLIAHTIVNLAGQRVKQSLLLLEASCRWSAQQGLTHWVVASEKRFYDYLLSRGWPFQTLGESKVYHGAMTVPVCLELDALLRWFDVQD